MSEKIAVIGLGYVGLPLLMGMARHFEHVTGFDIDPRRVATLCANEDWTGEIESAELAATNAHFTNKPEDIKDCSFFIITVPTPINNAKRPDLSFVINACQSLGATLKNRTPTEHPPVIVFESTVYPGLTEEICGHEIAKASGLQQGKDFKLGYSPERINPGDKTNSLETIMKIISAEDDATLTRLENVYGKIIVAGLYKAENIAVAEAAKVLENTQRDLNVALMNELAIICDHIGIRTHDVLAAAGTKWNFLKFTPGLVGGHCIGVDPYYLTARAEELGYQPQVILAGRRINDNMPVFIAQKILKLLVNGGTMKTGMKVGILGLSFKENVRDIRNSRVPEIVRELEAYGIAVMVHDPVVDANHAMHEYGLKLSGRDELKNLDALVLAVPHKVLMDDIQSFWPALVLNGYVIDIKSIMDSTKLPNGLRYWSL